MVAVITLIAILLYAIFVHRKLMNHLGLTQRDEKLMFMGFFINSLFGSVVALVAALASGASPVGALLFGAFNALIIYFNYRSL